MPFDSRGNWHEEKEMEDDWGKSSFGTTSENIAWGIKMFFALLIILALCVGGWILKGACYYTIGKAIIEEKE